MTERAEWLTVSEVATVFRVSRKTILRRIQGGTIDGVRDVGSPRSPRYRIPASIVPSGVSTASLEMPPTDHDPGAARRAGALLRRLSARLPEAMVGVYVIRGLESGVVKIGSTNDLRVRLRTHAGTLPAQMKDRPQLTRFVPCARGIVRYAEAVMLWYYAEFRRGRAELFDVPATVRPPEEFRDPGDILEAATELARHVHGRSTPHD